MKISAIAYVGQLRLSVALFVRLFILKLRDQEIKKNNLHQTLHTGKHRSGEEVSKFLRSWGQMSESRSDDHGNIANSIAGEPLKGFEPKLNTNTYYTNSQPSDRGRLKNRTEQNYTNLRDTLITFSRS